MADPFEVRMRFTSQLQHLNATQNSATKAAHYALKYRDMDEDLHSCILEQLERNNLNNRANIMYFIEVLCDMAARDDHTEFIRMMERDILKIIDLVAPDDGTGAANVKVVRKVLGKLREKSFLQPQTVMELEECIKDRDQVGGAANGNSPMEVETVKQGRAVNGAGSGPRTNGNVRLDKRQIEQRIEEDRERHKRLRESIWAVGPTDEDEAARLMEEAGDFEEEDFEIAREERANRAQLAEFQRQDLECV